MNKNQFIFFLWHYNQVYCMSVLRFFTTSASTWMHIKYYLIFSPHGVDPFNWIATIVCVCHTTTWYSPLNLSFSLCLFLWLTVCVCNNSIAHFRTTQVFACSFYFWTNACLIENIRCQVIIIFQYFTIFDFLRWEPMQK